MRSLFQCFNIFLLCLVSLAVAAQPAAVVDIARGCSLASLKKDLYFLASPQLEGRQIGTKGDTLTAEYVAAAFQKANLAGPYNGSYFQPVIAQKKTAQVDLYINKKHFERYDGWWLYPLTPVSVKDAPVVFGLFTVDEVSRYVKTHDVKGKVICVPGKAMRKAIQDNIGDSLESVWKTHGIAAVLMYNAALSQTIAQIRMYQLPPEFRNKELEEYEGVPAADDPRLVHEISLTPQRMNELLAGDKLSLNDDESLRTPLSSPIILKNKLGFSYSEKFDPVQAVNVIGIFKGTDTTLSPVVLSAHHDHQGIVNKQLYPGAVDNASGTVAIMEIARMLDQAAAKGYRPKRTILFGSWTGEEKGMIGSFWYVNHPVYPVKETHAVLNIDMLGRVDTFYSGRRPDSNYAYILVMDSVKGFRNDLLKANDALTHLKLDTYYERPENMRRRLLGSDQFPFWQQGVPFVRIDCGFAKDYHKPTDTPDKINYPLLTEQTKLTFLTLWNMADR